MISRAKAMLDFCCCHDWKAGPIQGKLTGTREVIMSRWGKPVRIVPADEVADNILQHLNGEIDEMPSNVVTPQVRAALEAKGMRYVETNNQGKIKEGENKGKTWSSVYKPKRRVVRKSLQNIDWNAIATKEQKAEHLRNIPDRVGIKVETTTYAVDDEEDLEALHEIFDDDFFKDVEKDYHDINTLGSCYPDAKIIIVFTNKLETLLDVEET